MFSSEYFTDNPTSLDELRENCVQWNHRLLSNAPKWSVADRFGDMTFAGGDKSKEWPDKVDTSYALARAAHLAQRLGYFKRGRRAANAWAEALRPLCELLLSADCPRKGALIEAAKKILEGTR